MSSYLDTLSDPEFRTEWSLTSASRGMLQHLENDGERAQATFLREREAEAYCHYNTAGKEEAVGRYGYAADYRRAGDLSLSVFSTDK